MANRFKQAAPKAKKLYKSGRYKTFAAAMAQALKTTGKKKRRRTITPKRRVGSTKFIERGETRNTPVKSVIRRNRTKNGLFKSTTRLSGISIGSLKSTIRQKIKFDLDKAVLKKYHATKKRAKKQAQKTITAFKAALRKYS